MRHRKQNRKLGRTSSHRKAMLANMASSLIMHDRIETTLPKAKELRRLADKLVTLSKQGTVPARRRAIMLIRDKKAVERAFDTLANRYADRKGGYTRIMKLGWRHGDSAEMAVIEYIRADHEMPVAAPKKGKAKKASKKEAKKAEPKKEAAKEEKAETKAPARKAKPRKAAGAKKTARKAPAKKKAGGKAKKKG